MLALTLCKRSRHDEAVLAAEVYVDQCDIRPQLVGEAECLVACRRRTGDLDPLLLEQPARGVQELRTVVDDQAAQLSNRHGRRASQTGAAARIAASRKSRGSGGREVDWALASMNPPSWHDTIVLGQPPTEKRQEDTMKRLLVLEDDPEIGDLLRLIFEEAGFSVAVVRDVAPLPLGTVADLVISDLALPRGYDSEAAVRGVRALRSSSPWPLLVLTAHDAAASDGELAKEATAVMTKPFDLEALLASVASLTGFPLESNA